MTTTIDEIIEKIWYIKRYADTRYFDWNEAKKELKTILDKHLNKLDTGKVDVLLDKWKWKYDCKEWFVVETYIQINEFISDLQSLKSQLPQEIDTGKVDKNDTVLYTKEYYDKIPVDEEVLSQEWEYVVIGKRFNGKIYINDFKQSLKSQLHEDEKDKLIEQIECMQVELDWYKNKSQLPEKPSEPSEQVEIKRKIIQWGIWWLCQCGTVLYDHWLRCPYCQTKINRVD